MIADTSRDSPITPRSTAAIFIWFATAVSLRPRSLSRIEVLAV